MSLGLHIHITKYAARRRHTCTPSTNSGACPACAPGSVHHPQLCRAHPLLLCSREKHLIAGYSPPGGRPGAEAWLAWGYRGLGPGPRSEPTLKALPAAEPLQDGLRPQLQPGRSQGRPSFDPAPSSSSQVVHLRSAPQSTPHMQRCTGVHFQRLGCLCASVV